MSIMLKPGARLLSTTCTTEMISIKAPQESVELTIGGMPPVLSPAERESTCPIVDGHGGGTGMGKRYVSADTSIELLCTKAGEGVPAVDGEVLVLKDAKPLPASD